MASELTLVETECLTIHQLNKRRIEDLMHILMYRLETESYREEARKELKQLVLLEQKLDIFLQDVENMRRETV